MIITVVFLCSKHHRKPINIVNRSYKNDGGICVKNLSSYHKPSYQVCIIYLCFENAVKNFMKIKPIYILYIPYKHLLFIFFIYSKI